MATIAVVLPVFNAESTIRRAVNSILSQTWNDLELVIVNDGSTDGTAEVLSSIDDSRLKVIHADHVGVAEAANLATQSTSAPFVARMDADDWSHPDRLQLQFELLNSEKLDVVGSQVSIVDENGDALESLARYQRWINEETLFEHDILALRFVELPIVNPTILARREYYEPGFRCGDFPEDYDLMLRAAAEGMRFGKVAKVLFEWTDHSRRLTRTHGSFTPDAFMRCRREHLLAGTLNGIEKIDVWGVGKTGKPWIQWLLEQGIEIRNAYDISERRVGKLIHGSLVRHPRQLAAADGTMILIAVGAANAREVIRPQLKKHGYVVGSDAWFVA